MFTPRAGYALPDQLSLEEQVLLVHLQGEFITTLQAPSQRINVCYWQGALVEIYCRMDQNQWTPFRIDYYPNLPIE